MMQISKCYSVTTGTDKLYRLLPASISLKATHTYPIPVDDAPEVLDEIWAAVLEVQVVSVLPDVNGQERLLAGNQRIHGVGRLENGQTLV